MKRTVIAGTLLLLFLSCFGDREDAGMDEGGRPTQIAEGFILTQTVSGVKSWCLKADKAMSYEDEGLIRVYGVTLEFYKEKGVHYSTLTAEQGILETSTNDMQAFGDVVVVAEDGTLKTDTLNWVEEGGKIRTDGFVEITKGETVITGRGFESDPTLEHVKIENEFRASGTEGEE